MLTIDAALHNVKGLNESVDFGVGEILDTYTNLGIIDMYNTEQTFEKFTAKEGMTGAKQLGELETPPDGVLEEGYSVTLSEDRYGLSITLPESVYRRLGHDSSVRVQEYLIEERNQLLRDVQNLLVTDYHLFFNDAFDGNSLLAPDGLSLCNDAHAWSTAGAATWDNKTTAAFSSAAVDAMETYGGAFTGPSGKPTPVTFDTIVVKRGSDAHREAIRLFASQITPTAVNDINIYEGQYKIVSTPYITNPLHWFGLCSMEKNPMKLGIGEAPTLREPKVLNNEAIRTNCTAFWKKGITAMPKAVYGGDGTA